MAKRELISINELNVAMKRTAKSESSIAHWAQLEKPLELFKPPSAGLSGDPVIDLPPYVVYVSNTAFEPSYVSANVQVLLGVSAERFVGNRNIWKEIIPEGDHDKVFERFRVLNRAVEISFTHRIFDRRGIPTWVSHRVRVAVNNGFRSLCGSITPISSSEFLGLLDPTTISSFVHKLGNHFQLLHLALNSLCKGAFGAQETNVIQETLDKAVSLTRAFSEFSQPPAWVSAFEFIGIIDIAVASQSSILVDHRVEIAREFDPGAKGLDIQGDPYLLELAIGAILQNAVEATDRGKKITVRASVESGGGVPSAVLLVVTDDGAGIENCNLSKVMIPFFSTKANHDGLGLSMAARFVELHGGILRITSEVGKGTEVQILLPLKRDTDDSCR